MLPFELVTLASLLSVVLAQVPGGPCSGDATYCYGSAFLYCGENGYVLANCFHFGGNECTTLASNPSSAVCTSIGTVTATSTTSPSTSTSSTTSSSVLTTPTPGGACSGDATYCYAGSDFLYCGVEGYILANCFHFGGNVCTTLASNPSSAVCTSYGVGTSTSTSSSTISTSSSGTSTPTPGGACSGDATYCYAGSDFLYCGEDGYILANCFHFGGNVCTTLASNPSSAVCTSYGVGTSTSTSTASGGATISPSTTASGNSSTTVITGSPSASTFTGAAALISFYGPVLALAVFAAAVGQL